MSHIAQTRGSPGQQPPSSTPTVSVVVPTSNASATIESTLSSVLRQTNSDFEILVCDDGSTDDTIARARSLMDREGPVRFRILPAPGGGPGSARNVGIRAARGTFIAFLDDDDAWQPRKIDVCLREMANASLDLVCHAETWIYEDGRRRVRVYSDLFDRSKPAVVSLMRNNPFSTSAVMVRRSRVLDAGLFDEDIPSAEDYDLWIRLALLPDIRIGFVDEPLGTYLVRTGSESSKIDRRLRALEEIGARYKRPLARAARLGWLEYWIFLSRSNMTSGVRYLKQGNLGLGFWLTLKGLAMWPMRIDWIRLFVKERLWRRSPR